MLRVASEAAHIAATQSFRKGEWLLCDLWGDRMSPWTIQRAMRAVRDQVEGLPPSFSYHDLRHYFASMLIADGADVKKVQAALRHASAKTTLDTYSHLWPDADETIRAAGDKVLRARLSERESDSNRTVEAEKGP